MKCHSIEKKYEIHKTEKQKRYKKRRKLGITSSLDPPMVGAVTPHQLYIQQGRTRRMTMTKQLTICQQKTSSNLFHCNLVQEL